MNHRPILLLAAALASGACTASVQTIALAPPGVHVQPAVAQGFSAFETRLAAFGTWAPDRDYGVHWCPSASATEGAFQPYLSRGHWALADAPIGRAPAGSPVWESDDSDTWGEITTHHGFWIHVPAAWGGPWCWVPGLEETPGRVVWREGDGFVGWAPEPPDWLSVASDDIDYEDGLDWVFTLLGTLLSNPPDQNTLSGDAARAARAATAPHASKDGSIARREVGPSGTSIKAARAALSDYIARHPDVIAAAAKTASTAQKASGSGSSKSASTSSARSKEEAWATVGLSPMPMPYAMVYYDALMAQPAAAPAGLLPRPRSAEAWQVPGSRAFGSGSAALTGGGARSTHSTAAAQRAWEAGASRAPLASPSYAHVRSSSSSSVSSPRGSSSHASSRSSSSSRSHSAHR
jgi:hypothetical protein